MDDYSHIFESPLLPLVEHSFAGIALARPNPWRMLYANAVLSAWLKCTASDLPTRGLEELISTTPPSELGTAIAEVWQGSSCETTIAGRLMVSESYRKPVHLRFVRIDTAGEALLGILVKEAGRLPAALGSDLAMRRDPLTGLLDRSFLLARLDALLQGDRSADHSFAILFVDLDNFKQINDACGHLVGDGVLGEVAGRLSQCVREGDYVVRFGGDEFVVLIEGIADGHDVQPVVERIHNAFKEPISLPSGEFRLSLSIGAAEASPEYRSPQDLLTAADRAMYASKRLRT